jgi:hypothetical protein
MVAKKSPIRRPPGPHEGIELHMKVTAKRDGLRAKAAKARGAWRTKKASELDAHADAIDETLTSVDTEFRAVNQRTDS